MMTKTWIPKAGERCVIASVRHPAFADDIGLEVTFLRSAPGGRWGWIDVDVRRKVLGKDGIEITRIRKCEKSYLIDHLAPLTGA